MTPVKPSLAICGLFAALLFVNAAAIGAQTSGSLHGSVKDAHGAALPDVSLTLSSLGPPSVSLHARTDKLGEFHFDHLPWLSYKLSTDQNEATLSPNPLVTITAAAPIVQQDVVLTQATPNPARPAGLQLQAAGIRGYIDPGGYSAPAGAAAASNLIRDAAGLNSAQPRADQTVACEHQDTLVRQAVQHPDDPIANRKLGQYYLATQQPQKALPSLQHAWSLNPHDPQTLSALAEALLQTREFQAAYDLLAAQPQKNTAAIHRLLARSEEGLGNFKQAAADYQTAAQIDPLEADFYGEGYELILAGSAAAALKVFDAGLARYPDSATLLMGIGTANFLLGQNAEATRVFLRCVTLHPDQSRAYPFLSASFAISGDEPDLVLASFRHYSARSPHSAEAAYYYAVALLQQSSTAAGEGDMKAMALLQRSVELDPHFAKAHLRLGSLYFDNRDYTHAIAEFNAALTIDPQLAEAHYKLSAAYRRNGQADLADQQMHIFLASKAVQPGTSSASGKQLEQYLSVFQSSSSAPSPGPFCNSVKSSSQH